ncbi:hypothetical protein [Tabrizicola sp.]|uniref:hypothetical protein n=1 Tax=Tabrizicola sp. TaxID=2005166 RepID=UPI003F2FDE46
MKHAVLALVAGLALAAPVAAQSMSTLLPVLTFPTDDVTTGTKGCDANPAAPTCQLQE